MRRITRLTVLILAVIMLLQCAAAASYTTEAAEHSDPQTILQPPETSEPDPTEGSDTTEPVDLSEDAGSSDPADPPEDADPTDPGEAPELDEPITTPEITISASLKDGQLVHNPIQSLSVTATEEEAALQADAITVTMNGAALKAANGAYPLTLAQGDNAIEITAAGSKGSKTLTLTVRFEILIPETWAHDALAFCVEHGILNGNAYGDLLPTDFASRSQLAAMLVRLFAAEPTADLSGYTDMTEGVWYYNDMARAVAMGIFEGSNGQLNPQQPITREQAFTVLARAFGVAAGSLDALDTFSDGDDVSTWAASSVAGMLEAGYIHGTSSGTIDPKSNITRQELAQVLFNALDCITDDPEALDGSRILYTGPIDQLAGKTIPGSLIVSCSSDEDVTLTGLTVEGRLVLHLHNAKTLTLDADCDTIAVCCPIDVTFTNPVDTLLCLRDGASIRGTAANLILLADVTLRGNFDAVYGQGGNPVISASSRIQTMYIRQGCTISLYGKADAVHAEAKNIRIEENGHIASLYQYHNNLQVSCSVDKIIDRVDAGLEGVSIVAGPLPEAFTDKPNVTVTGTITGVNTTQVYGVPGGVRTCTVTYSYNGKVIKTDTNFKLKEGAQLSCPVTAVVKYNVEENQNVSVTIRYDNEVLTASLPFRSAGRVTYYQEALGVKTIHVIATVKYSTSLYSTSSLTGYQGSIAAGTHVTFIKYSDESGSTALIETSSGARRWISGKAITISWKNYHNNDVSYSQGAKEAFVNEVHNYSSKTKYLIWCNLYTTTVNIFEGSQGNWKLIKSCECVIGAPNSPTRPGVYSLYSRAYYWSFDESPRMDVSRCYYASLFDGGIAFHTRLYYTGTNNYVNSSLSAAISHGCVRCPDDIAKFIYYDCPIGTTVVVY